MLTIDNIGVLEKMLRWLLWS